MVDKAIIREISNRAIELEFDSKRVLLDNLTAARNNIERELKRNPELLGSAKFAPILDQYISEATVRIAEDWPIEPIYKEGQRAGKFIVGSEAQVPKDSAFWGWTPTLPINAISFTQSQAAVLIQDVGKELKTKILRTVQTGLAQGADLRNIQEQILGTGLRGMKGRDGVWRTATSRAEMQARTITNDVLNRGALATYHQIDNISPELKLRKYWQNVSDNRSTARCISLGGQAVGLNDDFIAADGWRGSAPPSHPNAYLPDQTVLAVHDEVLNRHWYDGVAVELVLSNGVTLKVTADHPILTTRGFIEAADITPIDNVFYNETLDFHNSAHVASEVVNNQVYPAIQDKFVLFQVLAELGFAKMVAPAVDLDENPINNQVDQIFIKGKISDKGDTKWLDNLNELLFKFRLFNPTGNEGSSGFVDGVLMSPFTGSPCLVSSLYPGFPFLKSQPTIEELLPFFRGSDFNSAFSKDIYNRALILSQVFANLIAANPRQISGYNFTGQLGGKNFRPADIFKIVQIKEVRRFRYVGHVYNLTSKDGLNVANGILTHNCRSRVTVLSEKYVQEVQDQRYEALTGQNVQIQRMDLGTPNPTAIKPVLGYQETLDYANQKYASQLAAIDESLLAENNHPRMTALKSNISSLENNALKAIANGDIERATNMMELQTRLEAEMKTLAARLDRRTQAAFSDLRKQLISQGDEATAVAKVKATKIEKGLPHSTDRKGQFYQDNLTDLHRMSGNKVNNLETLYYKDDRAFAAEKGIRYSDEKHRTDGRINVGKKAAPIYQKTSLYHEFGHHIEFESDDINRTTKEFLLSKASSIKPVPLSQLNPNGTYRPNEVALPGDFYHPYVSKIYSDGKTEVIPMGLQQFASTSEMKKFYQGAPDHFRLILGILS